MAEIDSDGVPAPAEAGPPREIPLFPLRTVLFPGGVLPLRIFETRYIDMVRRCTRSETGFGVVLIETGHEVGDVVRIHDVGTLADIVDFSRHDDGLLGITALGRRRFRILEARRERDGLNVGRVAWLEDGPARALPGEYELLADVLRQALPQLGAAYQWLEQRYGDAAWVAGRLAEILPLPLEDKQRCLELEDPIRRLELLRPIIEDAARSRES